MESLQTHYYTVKEDIERVTKTLENLKNSKNALKREIITQELNNWPPEYYRKIDIRLTRIKSYVESCPAASCTYRFIECEQALDNYKNPIRDPLNWDIQEYHVGILPHIEIQLHVSKLALKQYITDWFSRNSWQILVG